LAAAATTTATVAAASATRALAAATTAATATAATTPTTPAAAPATTIRPTTLIWSGSTAPFELVLDAHGVHPGCAQSARTRAASG